MLNVYVNTWKNYNENGADGGEWVELPMFEPHLEETLERIAESMGDDDAEWFINDYEWTADNMEPLRDIDENDDILELNNFLEELSYMSEWELTVYRAAVEVFGADYVTPDDVDDFLLLADITDEYDLGYYYVHDLDAYNIKSEPISSYIDYDALGRDLSMELDGDFSSYGWIQRQ